MNASEEMVIPSSISVVTLAGVPIGSAVIGPEGGNPIGVVDKVAISPSTGAITHLLIKCLGERLHYILAPMSGVGASLGGIVQLNVPVEPGSPGADCAGDDSAASAHDRVDQYGYAPEQVLVALPEATAPPQYPADEDILAQAAATLRAYGPTRMLVQESASGETVASGPRLDATIRVAVRNGVVILAGNVELHAYAGMAGRLVRQIPGVREVLNLLLADDDLRTSVAAAIHHDPRTHGLQPRLSVQLGRVTLRGSVPDAASREAAHEVAATVRGVRGVENQLRVAY